MDVLKDRDLGFKRFTGLNERGEMPDKKPPNKVVNNKT